MTPVEDEFQPELSGPISLLVGTHNSKQVQNNLYAYLVHKEYVHLVHFLHCIHHCKATERDIHYTLEI